MNKGTNPIERQKLRAISVNNKPQYHTKQEIAMALKILSDLEEHHFDHSIHKKSLVQALQHHLVNAGSTSDNDASPTSTI